MSDPSPTVAAMHRARHIAEAFGSDPARYDRARPAYPDALVDRIAASAPGPQVLDVGTGTGVVARQLGGAGFEVLGVEPDPRMAEFARTRGATVEVSAFERWDRAGRVFDAVVSGTAWHWVDPRAGAERAAEALRPGGLFCAFWNVADVPEEVRAAFHDVYARLAPEAAAGAAYRRPGSVVDGYGAVLDTAAAGLDSTGAFDAPSRTRFDWERRFTRDEWLDLVPTQGGGAGVPDGGLDALLDGLGRQIDRLGGAVTARYGTLVLEARRR